MAVGGRPTEQQISNTTFLWCTSDLSYRHCVCYKCCVRLPGTGFGSFLPGTSCNCNATGYCKVDVSRFCVPQSRQIWRSVPLWRNETHARCQGTWSAYWSSFLESHQCLGRDLRSCVKRGHSVYRGSEYEKPRMQKALGQILSMCQGRPSQKTIENAPFSKIMENCFPSYSSASMLEFQLILRVYCARSDRNCICQLFSLTWKGWSLNSQSICDNINPSIDPSFLMGRGVAE